MMFADSYHLNSTVILLIFYGTVRKESKTSFKFHCDSINMEFDEKKDAEILNLNSTVILLISTSEHRCCCTSII